MAVLDITWFGLVLFLGLTAIGISNPERQEMIGFAGFVALIVGIQSLILESMLMGAVMVLIGLTMLFAVLRDRI